MKPAAKGNDRMESAVRLLKPVIEKFPLIASFYRFYRDQKRLMRAVEYRPKLGFKFIGSALMERGDFEPDESEIFDKIINNFDLLINVGANTGYYCLKALSKNKNVIAFEPNELNTKTLLRNVYENEFSHKIHIFQLALSDHVGILPIYGADTGASLIKGWAGQNQHTLVPVNTFDNVTHSLVDNSKKLVLVDIEGAEYNFLHGAYSILKNPEDTVFMMEISVAEHQPTGTNINPRLLDTFQLMDQFGYSAFTCDSRKRSVQISEISEIVRTGIDTLGTHNFIFINKDTTLERWGL